MNGLWKRMLSSASFMIPYLGKTPRRALPNYARPVYHKIFYRYNSSTVCEFANHESSLWKSTSSAKPPGVFYQEDSGGGVRCAASRDLQQAGAVPYHFR